MDFKFIFYGSLMNLDLLYEIIGNKPKSIEIGYVHGDLYEVVDHTEPMGIHRYPILVQNQKGNVVICIQVTFCTTRTHLIDIFLRLNEFEGDLYKPCVIEFISFNGKRSMGYAYICAADKPPEKSSIKKILPISGVYLWKF